MAEKVTREYWTEKVEAYNVAIEALRHHEPASDCDLVLAKKLRDRLADKLDREIDKWVKKNPMPQEDEVLERDAAAGARVIAGGMEPSAPVPGPRG